MPLRTWASYNMRHCPVLRQEIRTGMSRMLWHPTQAQTGLEWGTQRLLTMKQSKKSHNLSGLGDFT
jgi:hypothetical protein